MPRLFLFLLLLTVGESLLAQTANSPQVRLLSPNTAEVGDSSLAVSVTGSRFGASSIVTFDNVSRVPTFVSSSLLTFRLSAADTNIAKIVNVTVTTPSVGASNAVRFQIFPKCGDEVAHAYNGVSAYSNGRYTADPSGNSCVQRFNTSTNSWVAVYGRYGYMYQCVEFVRRFYAALDPARFGDGAPYDSSNKSLWHGNANSYYYGISRRGTAPETKGLIRIENDGTSLPARGDIIVFDKANTYGHVAIANDVSASAVRLIEQNWSTTGTEIVEVDPATGRLKDRAGYKVLGWLRAPNQLPTAGFTMTDGVQTKTNGQTLSITVPAGSVARVTISSPDCSPGPAVGCSYDPDGSIAGREWKLNGVPTFPGPLPLTYSVPPGINTWSL